MKYILFILFFNSTFLFSQKIKGIVMDYNKNKIQNVLVQNLNTKKNIFSDNEGYFEINANVNDTIVIKSLGFSTLTFYVSSDLLDGNVHFFYLKEISKVLNTVEVNSDRLKDVFNYKNENVIDFEFWNGFLLVLSHKNNAYYLSLIRNGMIKKKYTLTTIKPKKIKIDCYQNIHISTKNISYQIQLDTSIHYIDSVVNEKYDLFLEPIIYCNDNLFSEKYIKHNQKYLLLKFNQLNKTNDVIYYSYDTKQELIAKQKYNEIIAYYYSVTNETENIILNKFWDGDVLKLAVTDTLIEKIGWYKNIISQNINVQSFSLKNSIVIFDFFKDSIFSFNSNGEKIYSTDFLYQKTVNKPQVLLDNKLNQFYIYYPSFKSFKIDKINILTGKNTTILNISDIINPKKCLIHNNWIYILDNIETSFYKLYKIKLDVLAPQKLGQNYSK